MMHSSGMAAGFGWFGMIPAIEALAMDIEVAQFPSKAVGAVKW